MSNQKINKNHYEKKGGVYTCPNSFCKLQFKTIQAIHCHWHQSPHCSPFFDKQISKLVQKQQIALDNYALPPRTKKQKKQF